MTDAKIERESEHPSGLRDAIANAVFSAHMDFYGGDESDTDDQLSSSEFATHAMAYLDPAIVSALSVVSEEEREQAARDLHGMYASALGLKTQWSALNERERGYWRQDAESVLAASRGVLFCTNPQSDENGGGE